MFLPVEQVKEGDMLELQGDRYADPNGDEAILGDQFVVALHDALRETPECTTLHLGDFDLVGFPVGHLVRVMGNDGNHESELDPGQPCTCGFRKDKR